MYLKNLSIILVDTQLPENIGLVARSMFNFGFEKLKLVNPKVDWPNEKALAVSVDASSIIENASIYSSLREALNDETYSIAFTARKRDMNKEFFNSNIYKMTNYFYKYTKNNYPNKYIDLSINYIGKFIKN